MDVTPLIRRDAKVIQSYKAGQFKVSNEIFDTALIVFPDAVVEWDVKSVADLTIEDFKPVIDRADEVEVLLLGCGSKMTFIAPELREGLKQHAIVIDTMDTGAACRTYNVLMAEGRQVCTALFKV